MYKRGQGTLVRSGMLAVILCFAFYTGYSWYNFQFDPESSPVFNAAIIGAVLLGGAMAAVGVWTTIFKARTAEFMINADAELRKVIWPATQPLFDKKAEAWGATYVVIMTMIILTVFIYVVDIFLEWFLQNKLLLWIYS